MSAETPSGKPAFIDINELRAANPVTVERLFQYYSAPLPAILSNSREQRIACPFPHCGKKGPTGPKAISIQQDARGFIFRCFNYGCSKGGNDVSFADLLRDTCGDGKPRGDRFRQILQDYIDMAGGGVRRVMSSSSSLERPSDIGEGDDMRVNVPLEESDNERARTLVDLPSKFVTDLAQMPPVAAAYIRSRSQWFADPEKIHNDWGVGYLPMDSGGDRTGGTMRGKIVFPIHALDGKLLAFCGRDPTFEEKQAEWHSLPEAKRAEIPEAVKYRFPKNFHRGLELWGQERIPVLGSKKKLKAQGGLFVVEGPGDVIRLSQGGVLSVGLMSNQPTREQVTKIVRLAWDYADGRVLLMLDLDEEGRKGMFKLLQAVATAAYVRVAWTSELEGGKYRGKQPEELSDEEIARLLAAVESKKPSKTDTTK